MTSSGVGKAESCQLYRRVKGWTRSWARSCRIIWPCPLMKVKPLAGTASIWGVTSPSDKERQESIKNSRSPAKLDWPRLRIFHLKTRNPAPCARESEVILRDLHSFLRFTRTRIQADENHETVSGLAKSPAPVYVQRHNSRNIHHLLVSSKNTHSSFPGVRRHLSVVIA